MLLILIGIAKTSPMGLLLFCTSTSNIWEFSVPTASTTLRLGPKTLLYRTVFWSLGQEVHEAKGPGVLHLGFACPYVPQLTSRVCKGLFPGPVLSRVRVWLGSTHGYESLTVWSGKGSLVGYELEAVHGPPLVRNSEECGNSEPAFPIVLKVCLSRKD